MNNKLEVIKRIYANLNHSERLSFVEWVKEMEDKSNGFEKREKFREEIKRDAGPMSASVCPICLK